MSEPEPIPDYPASIRSEIKDPYATERFAAIPLCPCCVTAQDIEVEDGAEVTLTCVACGQTWTQVVDRERQAAHSVN
jgi:hypothetical protein